VLALSPSPFEDLDCKLSSHPEPTVVFRATGNYSEAVPLKRNPLLAVPWHVPAPLQVTIAHEGTTSCEPIDNALDFLPLTPGGPAPGVLTDWGPALTPEFLSAWGASDTVPGKYLIKHLEWTRSFAVTTTAFAPPSFLPATESGTFKFSSTVTFKRVTVDVREVTENRSFEDKVGALLVSGGLAVMSGFDPDALSPNDSILLPGMPAPGTVSTDVSGQVAPSPSHAKLQAAASDGGREATSAASGPVLLATGSGSSGQPDSTIVLRLHLKRPARRCSRARIRRCCSTLTCALRRPGPIGRSPPPQARRFLQPAERQLSQRLAGT
jgi:hypothetical protein